MTQGRAVSSLSYRPLAHFTEHEVETIPCRESSTVAGVDRRRRREDNLRLLPLTRYRGRPMNRQPDKLISKDHPITIEPAGSHVVVRAGGRVVADTTNALVLREARYPPVLYIPRSDIDMTLFERTDHATRCPYKGAASYFSVRDGGPRAVNAAWSYESPFDQVAPIEGHLAFYPDRVDAIEQS
jgi:uncharacterized protein (DUF427 family)